jgi:hypothetical protein
MKFFYPVKPYAGALPSAALVRRFCVDGQTVSPSTGFDVLDLNFEISPNDLSASKASFSPYYSTLFSSYSANPFSRKPSPRLNFEPTSRSAVM